MGRENEKIFKFLRSFRSPTVVLVTGLVLMLVAGTASQTNAAFVEYTTNFDFVDGPSHNVTINEFDTTLGTLTGISLTTDVNLTGQVQLINFTSSPQNFTNARSFGPFSFTDPAGTVIGTAISDSGYFNGTAAAGYLTVSTFSGSGVPYQWTTSIASGSFGFYQGGTGDLATFVVASGPYTSSASFEPTTLGVGGNALIDGTLTVQYDYNAVPIPGAVWLLGSGLVGLVGFCGRKKSKCI